MNTIPWLLNVFRCLSMFLPLTVFAVTENNPTEASVHLGMAFNDMGKSQDVRLQTLPDARFTINQRNHNDNGIFGLGLSRRVMENENANFSFGLLAFYLFQTSVTGNIYQAKVINNLGYRYTVENLPIYFHGKTQFTLDKTPTPLYLDVGLGGNFMSIGHYQEWPTLPQVRPDLAYNSNLNITFSVTIGAGLTFMNAFGSAPLSCGYRFFYLGSGELSIRNSQYATPLSTGASFSNAVICSVTI